MRILAFQSAPSRAILSWSNVTLDGGHPMQTTAEQQREAETLATIRERVRAECLTESNRFGPAFFDQHLAVVVERGLRLAARIGADPVVVEAAGWLHDLAAIRDLTTVPTHAADGAPIARALLSELGWPPDRAEAVARTVAAHSAPGARGQVTPEELCLSHADVLAQIARPLYWCHYVYGVRGLSFTAGAEWLRSRAEVTWQALIPEARELGARDREALLRLLSP
jgi:hypothetical protein